MGLRLTVKSISMFRAQIFNFSFSRQPKAYAP